MGQDAAGARGESLRSAALRSHATGALTLLVLSSLFGYACLKYFWQEESPLLTVCAAALAFSVALMNVALSQPAILIVPERIFFARFLGSFASLVLVVCANVFSLTLSAAGLLAMLAAGNLVAVASSLRVAGCGERSFGVGDSNFHSGPKLNMPRLERVRFALSGTLSSGFNAFPIFAAGVLGGAAFAGHAAALYRVISGPVWLLAGVQSTSITAGVVYLASSRERSRVVLREMSASLAWNVVLIATIALIITYLQRQDSLLFPGAPPPSGLLWAVGLIVVGQLLAYWRGYHDRLVRVGSAVLTVDLLRVSSAIMFLYVLSQAGVFPIAALCVLAASEVVGSACLLVARARQARSAGS
jgi:hypothetical protein